MLIQFFKNLLLGEKIIPAKYEKKEEATENFHEIKSSEVKMPEVKRQKRNIIYIGNSGEIRQWREGLRCDVCGHAIQKEDCVISVGELRVYCSESCWDESFEMAMRATNTIFGGHNPDVPVGTKIKRR